MILNKIKNHDGFTLVEMLVVIGLISIAGTSLSFFNFGIFKNESLKSETELLGTTLQTVRAGAQNNINNTDHGLAIYPDGLNAYVIFEGQSYASSDKLKNITIDSSYKLNFDTDSIREVVFKQMSGSVSNFGNILVVNENGLVVEIININYEGKISW